MKKVSTLFLAMLFCLGIASNCNAEAPCNFQDIVSNGNLRTIRVCVSLSMERGVRGVIVRQHIISEGKKIADVTNYSMADLFKISLKIYGIENGNYAIKKTTRIVAGVGTYYIFDYVSDP